MKVVDAPEGDSPLPPELRALQRRAFVLLQQEGYPAECRESGALAFKCEGGTFILSIYQDDPDFQHVVFPCFWPIVSDDERQRALLAVNRINRDVKFVKLYLTEDLGDVCGSVELLLTSPEGFPQQLRRATRALWAGARNFRAEMKRLSESPSQA